MTQPFTEQNGPLRPSLSVVQTRGTVHDSAIGDEAERRQAHHLSDELHQQVIALSEQYEVLQVKLARCTRNGSQRQAALVRDELRRCLVERRNVINMISALNHRFLPET